jgi:hypothetical protein
MLGVDDLEDAAFRVKFIIKVVFQDRQNPNT